MKLVGLSLGVCALVAVAGAAPKHSKRVSKVSGPETGLVGIKLYDSNTRVLDLYGSPDQIEAINFGGTSSGGPMGGAGGRGGPMGGPMGPSGMGGGSRGPMGGGGSPGRPGAGPAADYTAPFDFGNEVLRQSSPMGPPPGMQGPGGRGGNGQGYPGGPMGPGGGGYPGAPSGSGYPGAPGGMGYPGAPGGAPSNGGTPGGGFPGAGGGSSERVTFTRWVYNRQGSKYGFIIDKSGRVVQVEAIGIDNAKVKTRRGIGFGANFASVIRSYGNPDAYEIGGDNILIRYLTRHKVAFRLSRLGVKAPQTVTGIVVAAGKQ